MQGRPRPLHGEAPPQRRAAMLPAAAVSAPPNALSWWGTTSFGSLGSPASLPLPVPFSFMGNHGNH